VTITIELGEDAAVSAIWLTPAQPQAAYVFAHGAGAGMAHKSMTAIGESLAARGIATLRYNFLYMGADRSDPTRLRSPTKRFAPLSRRRTTLHPSCRSSPAVNPSAGA